MKPSRRKLPPSKRLSTGTDERSRAAVVNFHGRQFLQAGDYEEALAAFTESIGLAPNQLSVYRDRAQAFQYLERGQEAEADLQKYLSIALAPNPDPMLLRFMCQVGRHKAHSWIYEAPRGCHQLGMCRRCGSKLTRRRHDFTWQYLKENSCRQVSICRRCNKEEPYRLDKTDHAGWREWGKDTPVHCPRTPL